MSVPKLVEYLAAVKVELLADCLETTMVAVMVGYWVEMLVVHLVAMMDLMMAHNLVV
jgi:hypothetical protein